MLRQCFHVDAWYLCVAAGQGHGEALRVGHIPRLHVAQQIGRRPVFKHSTFCEHILI